jgi:hypothetical protein
MRDGIAEAYTLNEIEWLCYLKFQVRMEREGLCCDATPSRMRLRQINHAATAAMALTTLISAQAKSRIFL